MIPGPVSRKEWDAFDARKKYQIPPIRARQIRPVGAEMYYRENVNHQTAKYLEKVCTPQHPVGACMVSNEGACSAYYTYGDKNKKIMENKRNYKVMKQYR